jgi:hypothetical protein
MAVVKITRSGRGITFIDDEGNVFLTSKVYLESLLRGTLSSNFILLQRLPDRIPENKFSKSPLFVINEQTMSVQEGVISEGDKVENKLDPMSTGVIQLKEKKNNFEDKMVW